VRCVGAPDSTQISTTAPAEGPADARARFVTPLAAAIRDRRGRSLFGDRSRHAGGAFSDAYAINDRGQVVGLSFTAGHPAAHAFLYDIVAIKDLGTLGGSDSTAAAINNAGQVVGISAVPGNALGRAFLKSPGGAMIDLGAGGGNAGALGINDAAQVVGYFSAGGTNHAFLYSKGATTDLGSLGGMESVAAGINEAGQVVGSSFTMEGAQHAFLYDSGQMQDLGTLGGTQSVAVSINEAGQIVGSSTLAADLFVHAFLYGPGGIRDIGALSGGSSAAYAINDAGQVVGASNVAGGGSHAFLYSRDPMTGKARMDDLNSLIDASLGWTLLGARGINNSGQIIGYGSHNGQAHAFLLSAVPEPATWAMMVAGFGVVGYSMRQKRRSCLLAA